MVAACAMLLETLILVLLVVDSGVVVGLLRGGRLRRLRTARLKALPLLVAALVLQLLLGLPGQPLPGGRWGIGSVLLTVSLLLLLVVVGANARLPGMALLAFGVLANLVVVGLNGGMPVSAATPQQAPTGITSQASQLGPQYLVAGPETRLSVLGAWVGVFGSQTVVSVGDVLQYLGLLLLIQGLMVGDVGRRPKPRTPAGGWTTLLRVAWLAILLGLLLQLAVLLVAAGFGTVAGSRSVLVEAFRTVSWSLLVCVGVALGRVAAKGRVPLEGVTGLLAAPLALTAANMVQKGVAEALNVASTRAGPVPLWVLALKAAEYAFLGLALGWVGRRAWGAALGHVAAGLATGMVFGGAFLALVVQAAPTPLSTPSLVAKGVNELLFPVGCALVVFIAEVLGSQVAAAAPLADPRPGITLAEAGEQALFPFPVGVGSRAVTLTVGPLCELNRGHWACATHRRGFATRRSLDRHIRLGEHRLVWLCWAHGPEQPDHRPAHHPGGDQQTPAGTPPPLTKVSQLGRRRSA
jgi:Family of unknown function (DUF5317)